MLLQTAAAHLVATAPKKPSQPQERGRGQGRRAAPAPRRGHQEDKDNMRNRPARSRRTPHRCALPFFAHEGKGTSKVTVK